MDIFHIAPLLDKEYRSINKTYLNGDIMGKGKRNKAKHSKQDSGFLPHADELLTSHFQKEIRNSEFWPMMVAEFGEQKAEELLRECKGELKPGVSADETGDRSTDF